MGHAYIVVGLGYGDEGKGTIVDWLVRRHGAGLVVRYNGGAQAAHNVVTPEGKHHTFSQIGSGYFAGAKTYLSPDVVVNPITMEQEIAKLGGTFDRERVRSSIYVASSALVTTPFQIAANRIREHARGDGRHGSTGMGIGETIADAEENGIALRVRDLVALPPTALRKRLRELQEHKAKQVDELFQRSLEARSDFVYRAWRSLTCADELDLITEDLHGWGRRVQAVTPAWLSEYLRGDVPVVFEGAQGVMLDQDWGFFPHVTRGRTTMEHALRLVAEAGGVESTCIGVTRAYTTRHGAGPMPTEDPDLRGLVAMDHNRPGEFQGALRVGPLDLVMLAYAAEVCVPAQYERDLDCIAVTCLDQAFPGSSPQATVPVCVAYDTASLAPGGRHVPLIGRYTEAELLQRIAQHTRTPVKILSRGPTWREKSEIA